MIDNLKSSMRSLVRLIGLTVQQLKGDDYYHLPQPKGVYIANNTIKGYYNDLRLKAYWPGKRDAKGIPISKTSRGKELYFPVTITQFALGHFDLWLETGDQKHWRNFLNVANWLLSSQDERGGWDVFGHLSVDALSPYSAMAQGQAISVLLRAFWHTKDSVYFSTAERALSLMLLPVEEGGVARYLGKALFLEEIVTEEQNTILNGWIFAIFGLWDFVLVSQKTEIEKYLTATLTTLEWHLKRYDRGWWSNYDWLGSIASPFYHHLHISLLEALYELTRKEIFADMARHWSDCTHSFLWKSKAVGIKVWQKLRAESEVVNG